MMAQLSFELESQPPEPLPAASLERRIDVTLARLADIHDSMTDEQRIELDGKKWWSVIVLCSRLRAMERAEEEALGRPSVGLADAYDRVVGPGENIVEAMLRTFNAVYG